MGELKWAPSVGERVVPILERSQVGIALGDFFVTLCLIQGMGLLDFPVFGFVNHYDMTRVDVLLKLMFSQRY